MPYSVYPTGDDVLKFLEQAGLSAINNAARIPLLQSCQDAADAAQSEWEQRTQWYPFLSTGNAAETRIFDGPGANVLDLQAGLLALASVMVGSFSLPLIAAGGAPALVSPRPANALNKGRPYTALAFGPVSPMSGLSPGFFDPGLLDSGYLSFIPAIRGLVTVVGTWGKMSTVPGDVFRALSAAAAGMLWPELQSLRTGGVLSVKDETLQVQFQDVIKQPFGTKFDELAQYHRRLTLG